MPLNVLYVLSANLYTSVYVTHPQHLAHMAPGFYLANVLFIISRNITYLDNVSLVEIMSFSNSSNLEKNSLTRSKTSSLIKINIINHKC